jgi:hypothetical protein
MPEDDSKSSTLSKLVWMIISAAVTALVAIPIGYYFVGPLTPKAALTSTLRAFPAKFVGRSGDIQHYQDTPLPGDRLYDTGLWDLYIYIKNIDGKLSAKDVTIHFNFSRPTPNPPSQFADAIVKHMGIRPADRCRDTTTQSTQSDNSINNQNANMVFVCDLINPSESHEFILFEDNALIHKIIVSLSYEGYSSTTDYTLCKDKNNRSLFFYVAQNVCP